MKKIILIALAVMVTHIAWCQKEIRISASTASQFVEEAPDFSFSEPITLIVDVSGVPALVGVEPLYVWAFINQINAPTNGDWGNSNEGSRMTKVSDNVWSLTIPSVKSFMVVSYKQAKDAAVASGREETETRFGFLVKAKDGSGSPEKKTGDIALAFTGPVYRKEKFENFPLNPAKDDVLTLTYNQDKEDVDAMKSVTEVYAYLTADITGGGTVTPEPVKLTKTGSRYTTTLIPTRFFELTASQSIDRIRVVMGAADPDVNFGAEKSVRIVVLK